MRTHDAWQGGQADDLGERSQETAIELNLNKLAIKVKFQLDI